MRGLFCVISLLFGLAAADVLAQTTTVPVRSGEHADFTRLVIQIPEENSWRVSTTAMQAKLLIEGPPLRFDISQAFARIPRTRLRSLNSAENQLELQLACPCEIRAYEDIPQFLVIDILGASPPDKQDLSETIRPRPRPAHVLQEPDAMATVGRRAGVLLARDRRALPEERSGPVSLTLRGVFDNEPVDEPVAQAAEQPVSETTRSEVSTELGEIIARTVAQGVLLPSDQDSGRFSSVPDMAGRDTNAQIAGMDAHLAMPDVTDLSDRVASDMQSDVLCPALAQLSRIDQDSDPALPAYPRRVSALYNELDMLDRAAAIALALDYLALGFGAESQMVAALFGADDPLAAIIRAMADIVDHEDAAPAAVAALANCGPAGSIWAFLGSSAPADQLPVRFTELLPGFEALPRPLRVHLGPRLVRKLVAADMTREAHRIQAAMDRISGMGGKDVQLARVALALAETPPPEQARRLEASLTPEISDEMLLFLLERRETDAAPVEAHLVALAENRLIALRGTAQGKRLAELTLRAMGRNGAFHAAFALAGSDISALPEASRDRALEDLLDMLSDQGSDADFVTLVFETRPWERKTLSPARARQIAERLISLGFDEQAALLAPKLNQQTGMETVIQEGMVGAIADIEAMPDIQGIPPAAAPLELSGNATGQVSAAQASSDDGRDRAGEDDPAFAQQSDLVPQPDPPESAPSAEPAAPTQADPSEVQRDQAAFPEIAAAPGMLDQSRALLSESSDFRSRLQMLLDSSDE